MIGDYYIGKIDESERFKDGQYLLKNYNRFDERIRRMMRREGVNEVKNNEIRALLELLQYTICEDHVRTIYILGAIEVINEMNKTDIRALFCQRYNDYANMLNLGNIEITTENIENILKYKLNNSQNYRKAKQNIDEYLKRLSKEEFKFMKQCGEYFKDVEMVKPLSDMVYSKEELEETLKHHLPGCVDQK